MLRRAAAIFRPGISGVLLLLTLAAQPVSTQLVFLQNDSFVSGVVNCETGIADSEGLASKFTAAPGQYPYTIDRVRVLGCNGGQDAYYVSIYQDDADTVDPGTLLWVSENGYLLDGGSIFNDILMSDEPVPPPPITAGSIRVEITNINVAVPIGFANDTDGITPHRNFLRSASGAWSFAESLGVSGDWVLRLGIIPANAPTPTPTPTRTPTPTNTPVLPTPTPTPPTTTTPTATPNPLAMNYFTLPPCRVIDTRNPAGPYGAPALSGGAARVFVLEGQCGVALGARAVSLNVTITQPTAPGDLRLYPAGMPLPLVSTINYRPGQTRANNAVASLGASGDLTVRCDQASGTVELIVDVVGYFQ